MCLYINVICNIIDGSYLIHRSRRLVEDLRNKRCASFFSLLRYEIHLKVISLLITRNKIKLFHYCKVEDFFILFMQIQSRTLILPQKVPRKLRTTLQIIALFANHLHFKGSY
ncbi:hypothetical protein ABFS83_02G096400 [Erythranthe nasuta]